MSYNVFCHEILTISAQHHTETPRKNLEQNGIGILLKKSESRAFYFTFYSVFFGA